MSKPSSQQQSLVQNQHGIQHNSTYADPFFDNEPDMISTFAFDCERVQPACTLTSGN